MVWIKTQGGNLVNSAVISDIVQQNRNNAVEITAHDASGDWFHKLAEGLTDQQAFCVMQKLGKALAQSDLVDAFTGRGHIVDIQKVLEEGEVVHSETKVKSTQTGDPQGRTERLEAVLAKLEAILSSGWSQVRSISSDMGSTTYQFQCDFHEMQQFWEAWEAARREIGLPSLSEGTQPRQGHCLLCSALIDEKGEDHWTNVSYEQLEPGGTAWACDRCGYVTEVPSGKFDGEMNYCPGCGFTIGEAFEAETSGCSEPSPKGTGTAAENGKTSP